MEIRRDRSQNTMYISQSDYVGKIIKKFGMSEAKAVCVLADPNVRLLPADDEHSSMCNLPYRETIGSLMYLAIMSRPDIAFAVNNLSQFLNKYDKNHWHAVKRIFAYLTGTKDLCIMYKRCEGGSTLAGYSDADYATHLETKRSTTSYIFCMTGSPVI